MVPLIGSGAGSGARAPAGAPARPQKALRSPEDRLKEATGLAEAIRLNVVEAQNVNVPKPRAGTLFGRGKVDELATLIAANEIALVVIDAQLSPVQQRNLERAWQAKVIDRTGLILEIFSARARTSEGRLQVELAHLTYQRGRLVRSWTHLERQRGGAGFLGGPGERQIELDRRLLQTRIDNIRKELESVIKTRALHRAGRRRMPYPIVALVGYTNAGKSTLFNRLTGAEVHAEDQVFATLDPTMRELALPSGRRVILSDTVGFISDLPTTLIAAFRATLEEVVEADIVLHVRDIAHPYSAAQRDDVVNVLETIGISAAPQTAPPHDEGRGLMLEVWNKLDLLAPDESEARLARAQREVPATVALSAITGEGCPELLARLDAALALHDEVYRVDVPSSEGALLHWLHQNSEVLARDPHDDGASLAVTVRIDGAKVGRLVARCRAVGVAPSPVGAHAQNTL
ncbi:MAG: GTPase HflX [Pseudomonadota bacterium]